MTVSSFEKKLAKIEKQIKELKLSIKAPTKSLKIDSCTTKKQLEKFKADELKDWLLKHKVDIKKVSKKVKATWINLVWKHIKEDSSDSDSDSSDSDSDSSDSDSD